MKTIRLRPEFSTALLCGRAKEVECVVEVDWFPRLTEGEILANVCALLDGEPEPYPNPNYIAIVAPVVPRV